MADGKPPYIHRGSEPSGKKLPCGVSRKASHQVRLQAKYGRLVEQVAERKSDIMRRMAVVLAVVDEVQLRKSKHQYRSFGRPPQIGRYEPVAKRLEDCWIVLCSNDEHPRLGIIARGCPSGGLQ